MLKLAATSLLAAVLAWPALAGDEDGRYRMIPTADGFLKLDTRSGAVSECKPGREGYQCPLVPGEGEAGLKTALMVARVWNAHVTAVYIRVDTSVLAELAGESLSAGTVKNMVQLAEQERGERLQALEAMFARSVAEYGITGTTPSDG